MKQATSGMRERLIQIATNKGETDQRYAKVNVDFAMAMYECGLSEKQIQAITECVDAIIRLVIEDVTKYEQRRKQHEENHQTRKG